MSSDSASAPTNTPTTACPVCGGRRFSPTFAAIGLHFERCDDCGFDRMQNPPDTSALADLYEADEASADAAVDDHERNLERFGKILSSIERHRQPGQFVDVGCSIGTSLVVARDRGWRPIGFDPSVAAIDRAKASYGVDARVAGLEAIDLPPGSVDAILMHHTLEHVEAPDVVVRRCFELLAPGGVMYQSLPNHGSFKARLLREHFGYGITDQHLSHFSTKSLKRLVRAQGFDVVHVATWSYRQDPRLLWDLCARFGKQRWLEKKCGFELGEPIDPRRYIDFLNRTKWAYGVCNYLWPARLCRWFRLGEDLHLIARKPD